MFSSAFKDALLALTSLVILLPLTIDATTPEGCPKITFVRDKEGRFRDGEYITSINSKIGIIDVSIHAPGNDCAALGGRIMDTAHPAPNNLGLGSPNQGCDPPGPGVGAAGAPGSPTENCADPAGKSVQNVLMIPQHVDSGDCANADTVSSTAGGTFTLNMPKRTGITDIGILNAGKFFGVLQSCLW